MTTNFETLENKILATLEEAGEEGIAALLNTVNSAGAHGSEDEIEAFRAALTRLVSNGLLAMARVRDSESKRWIPLPSSEALSLLQGLESVLRWSKIERLWMWTSSSPRAQVLLTTTGQAAARKLLQEHGWRGDN
jgi:hypothetical protein